MEIPNISYFLFKPDSEKKFGEMREYIEKNFQAVIYFAVEDWEKTIKILYKKHYDYKGDAFADSYESFLAVMRNLYGKHAIIAVVQDKRCSKAELVNRVFNTKKFLRNKYCKPNAIGLISNTAVLPEVKQKRRIKNNIKIVDINGRENKLKSMASVGEYRLHFLNFLHSPDDDVNENDNEIIMLLENDFLSTSKLMTEEDVNLVAKYKTYEIVSKYDNKESENVERGDNSFELE